jgi:hypothetical protein
VRSGCKGGCEKRADSGCKNVCKMDAAATAVDDGATEPERLLWKSSGMWKIEENRSRLLIR